MIMMMMIMMTKMVIPMMLMILMMTGFDRLYKRMKAAHAATQIARIFRGYLQRKRNKYVRRKKAWTFHAIRVQR
jgi:hypothetical protein